MRASNQISIASAIREPSNQTKYSDFKMRTLEPIVKNRKIHDRKFFFISARMAVIKSIGKYFNEKVYGSDLQQVRKKQSKVVIGKIKSSIFE